MQLILQYPQGRSVLGFGQDAPTWLPMRELSETDFSTESPSRIALHSRHFSLVPSAFYSEDDREACLVQLGMKEGTATAVQDVPEWDAQLVYSLEALPPGCTPSKPPESIWRGLLFAAHHLALRNQQPGMLAMVTPGQLYLLAFDPLRLQFFNSFPTPDIHDYLYFTLNCLDQWGQSPFHTAIYITGHLEEDSPLYTLLASYLGRIERIPDDLFPTNVLQADFHGTRFFDLLSFAACGSSADI